MAQDAVAHLLGEVQALPIALQALDRPQRMVVVAKAQAVTVAEPLVQHRLADVPERRVTQVVAQADRLGEVLVEAQRPATLRAIPHASSVWVSRVR